MYLDKKAVKPYLLIDAKKKCEENFDKRNLYKFWN